MLLDIYYIKSYISSWNIREKSFDDTMFDFLELFVRVRDERGICRIIRYIEHTCRLCLRFRRNRPITIQGAHDAIKFIKFSIWLQVSLNLAFSLCNSITAIIGVLHLTYQSYRISSMFLLPYIIREAAVPVPKKFSCNFAMQNMQIPPN